MKKIASLLAVLVFLFTGCNNQSEAKSDLSLCDSSLNDMFQYLETKQDETDKLESFDYSNDNITALLERLGTEGEGLNSITVYSKNITDETASQFIAVARQNNIPVTFAMSEISSDILSVYDKAFSITTNYFHAAEEMAMRIKEMWTSGTINDIDSNQIFTFSVIKSEYSDVYTELFYTHLTENMELYGIPMQINNILTPTELESEDTLAELRNNSEGFVVLADELLPYYAQYPPAGDGVEIITLQEGTTNTVKDYPFVACCYIDYKNYKLVADEILDGFNEKEFPLDDVLFPYIERTVYIPATVI